MKNILERWKIKKYSRKMENHKIFQKEGKLLNVPEGWKIIKCSTRMNECMKIFQHISQIYYNTNMLSIIHYRLGL